MKGPSGRVSHDDDPDETESSASHEATHDGSVEGESTSDDDLGGDESDPLATDPADVVPSDGSGSTSSNTSKRKKSGRGPGTLPEPTATSGRPMIRLKGDA